MSNSSQTKKSVFAAAVESRAFFWGLFTVTTGVCISSGGFAYVLLAEAPVAHLDREEMVVPLLVTLSFVTGCFSAGALRRLALSRVPKAAHSQLRFSAHQGLLLSYANAEFGAQRFASAAKVYSQVIASLSNATGAEFQRVLAAWAAAQIEQDEITEAELACDEFLQGEADNQLKVNLADSVASTILYKPISPWLSKAERLVRRALELGPDKLTLKGTLGGLLVEQGEFGQGEKFLRECLEGSPAAHDKAISSFYLGLTLREHGRLNEGNDLVVKALHAYQQPWLRKKAALYCPELLKAPTSIE